MVLPSPPFVPAVVTAALLTCAAAPPSVAQRETAKNASDKGYVADIVEATAANTDYRRVLFTGKHAQLVIMTLQANQDIGEETHDDVDQFIRVESGTAQVKLGDEEHRLSPGFVVVIPAGVPHNVINSGSEPLKLYTLYAPPEHPSGTVQAMKPEH